MPPRHQSSGPQAGGADSGPAASTVPVPWVAVCAGFGAPGAPHQFPRATTARLVASTSVLPLPERQLPLRSSLASGRAPTANALASNDAPGSALPVLLEPVIATASRSTSVNVATWMPYFAFLTSAVLRMSATSAFVGPVPLPWPTLLERLIALLQLRSTEL